MNNLTIYFNESIAHGHLYAKAYDFAVEKDGEVINFDTSFADDVNGFKVRIERYYKEFELTFKERSPMEIKALCQKHKEYLDKKYECYYRNEPEQVETKAESIDYKYEFAFVFRGK